MSVDPTVTPQDTMTQFSQETPFVAQASAKPPSDEPWPKTPSTEAPATNNAPATTPSAAGAGALAEASANQNPAPADAKQNAKHTLIGKIVSGFKNGGTGSSASQFWRGIIGGALVGMGAGEDAPVVARGPYGDVRDRSAAGAAGRGFRAGLGFQQQTQDRQNQLADRERKQKQEDQKQKMEMDDFKLRQAADARAQQQSIQNSVEHEKRMKVLDQTIATGNFEAAQRTAEVAQQQVKLFNDLNFVGAKPLTGSDGQPLQFKTHEEAENAAHDNPKFFIGNFKTRTVFDPTTGKYSVYKVPDDDIKNVQLKDPVTGEMHTIPRMTPSEYLDFQNKEFNIKKAQLEITKVRAEIDKLHNDTKQSQLYGKALNTLTAATDKDGNVDLTKIPAGDRAILTEHSAKNLEDALRVRTAVIEKHTKAVEAGDPVAIDEANKELEEVGTLINHYGGVLSTITGNKKATTPAQAAVKQQAGAAQTAAAAIFNGMTQPNSAAAYQQVKDAVKAGKITEEQGKATMVEFMKLLNKPSAGGTDTVGDNSKEVLEQQPIA